MHLRISAITLVLASVAFAQAPLRLKNRVVSADAAVSKMELAIPIGRVHRIVQFSSTPTQGTIDALTASGITVLAPVPVNGLLVTLDGDRMSAAAADALINGSDPFAAFDVTYVVPLDPADKISPLVANNGNFLVEFHHDVDPAEVRGLILNLGLILIENPDLATNHLLVHFDDANQIAALAADDRIAYIFPASDELSIGAPSRAYAGALTLGGEVGQYIATNGTGWDGAGLSAAALSYVFSQITTKVPSDLAKSEIQRAMAEWSKVIKVTWTQAFSATAAKTVNIIFASGSHGDAYPFDGRGGILAHTFYPAPPNPEPIAGDMHFDDDESWHIGANTDVFSVALHELGHALGLGHSDNPNDVMYPYYKQVTTLAAGDKAAILTMYAAQDSSPVPPNPTPPPTPAPATLTLTVQPPLTTTAGAIATLTGSVSGETGSVTVTYSLNGATGFAQMNGNTWTILNLPLAIGSNTITIHAADSSRNVSQIITITRQAVNASKDTTPPTLTINTSMTSTSLPTCTVSGTASDNVQVASITWSTAAGQSGFVTGIATWTAQVPILIGFNQITIRATDTSGNSAARTLTVRRN